MTFMSINLFRKHFQLCYVVRDGAHAMTRFRDRLGIANWQVLDTRHPESPVSMIAMAYAGDLMIELIEPIVDRPSIYQNWVPTTRDAMKLHHLGFLVHDEAEWRNALDQLAANGYADAYSGSFGDMLDFHYADSTAELGHYYELIHLRPEGEAFFAKIPRN
jgi:catechol 2,3-dioxygenase-like lactoylglutathione lyase family enzyme